MRLPDDPATRYALDVDRGHVAAGPIVRDACKRHLRDLEAGVWVWDADKARSKVRFFPDVLKLAKGAHEGQPFVLLPWQQFIVGSVHGWLDRAGARRFRIAYVEGGKGSGKTPLAAGLALQFMVADGEAGAEIYAAAATKDQADVAFRYAVAMVRQSAALDRRLTFSGGPGREYNIAHLDSGSLFRKVASDSPNSGYLVHFALIDEVHEHKTTQIVDMMEAGLKGRKQPLVFMITNSGSSRIGPCFYNHDYAAKVCAGVIEDDRYFGYVCGIDEGDDPFKDESCWPKANPSLGTTITVEYLRDQVNKARGMPSKEAVVRRLNFCEWTDAVTPWIDRDLWERAQIAFRPDVCVGLPCFLGLDLSAKRDLTALSAVWRDDNGKLWLFSWFWSPGETLAEAAKRDNVPYLRWRDDGHLFAENSRIVDKGRVAAFIQALCTTHNVQALAYDNAQMDDLFEAFERLGFESWIDDRTLDEEGNPVGIAGDGLRLVRHGQGFAGYGSKTALWMPRSISHLEELIVSGGIGIAPNPVLNWNSSSAVLKADETGNRKWDKRKSTGRIDGMVSSTQAVGLAMAADREEAGDMDGFLADPVTF